MKTLREFLIEDFHSITSKDILSMAKKLHINVNPSSKDVAVSGVNIEKTKGQIIINQFQIEFGLDEEF